MVVCGVLVFPPLQPAKAVAVIAAVRSNDKVLFFITASSFSVVFFIFADVPMVSHFLFKIYTKNANSIDKTVNFCSHFFKSIRIFLDSA